MGSLISGNVIDDVASNASNDDKKEVQHVRQIDVLPKIEPLPPTNEGDCTSLPPTHRSVQDGWPVDECVSVIDFVGCVDNTIENSNSINL